MNVYEETDLIIAQKKYYVKPDEFHKEYNASETLGKPSAKLIEFFEKIARKYSTKYNNLEQLDVDGCVNYALFEAIVKWDRYDRDRSMNIFAFFTQMIKNDLAIHYKMLKRHAKYNISLDVIYQESKK